MSDLQDPSGHYPPALPTNEKPDTWRPQVLDPLTQAFEVMIARITSCSGSLLRYWIAVAFTILLITCGRAPLSFTYSKPTDFSEIQAQMANAPNADQRAAQIFEMVFHFFTSGSVIIGAGILATLVFLLFRYFSSRFEFILIAQVADNRTTIGDAWGRYRDQGHSLFAFHAIVLTVCSIFSMVATFIAFNFFPPNKQSFEEQQSLGEMLEQISSNFTYFDLAMFPIIVFGSILLFLLATFVLNFVGPIMYRQNKMFLEAFAVAFDLFKSYPVAFIFYFIMRWLVLIVGSLISGIVAMTVTCLLMSPCFILSCIFPPIAILMIPLILIVWVAYFVLAIMFTVPLHILSTAYSLKFLEQFGEGFDFFTDNTGGWQEDYLPMAPVPYSQPYQQQGPIDPPPHP